MPYRNDRDSLLARKADLEQELAQLRDDAAKLRAIEVQEREVARELTEVRAALDGRAVALPASSPALDDVRVASPCTADWSRMAGDARRRFCAECGQYVYNVSSLTAAETQALLGESEPVCLRIYRRLDGTVMTADCPVGQRRVRLKQYATVAAGTILAGVAATLALQPRARPADLRDIYSVELGSHAQHHHMGTHPHAAVHMDGLSPVVPPVENTVEAHPKKPSRTNTQRHTMGAALLPPGRATAASCKLPGATSTD